VVVFDSISDVKALWIKGKDFSLNNPVMNSEVGVKFSQAAIASFQLSPQDYHRYHLGEDKELPELAGGLLPG